ncbi:hypothetical protein [Sphingomonas sp.]|uniref:hypothetical protein n=1 Tax=Sphingomonas sp. TaxID=28214 RepID=UPI0025F87BD5|nr:hypothetical protein [Sphingomonas sp.]MBV9529337.1 hypothetical protein [Sphingomonas sp.]
MDYKKMGMALGVFSVGLGLFELIGARRAARTLGVEGGASEGVIRIFGARELVAGAMLLRGPAVSTNVWNRVIGDVADLGTLLVAAPRTSRPRAVAGALAFVAGATALDVLVARGLDQQSGRTWPAGEASPA